jgi:AraC-like DNA-binding protein
MREGRNAFLDRLGDPFLFAEEGFQNLHAGEARRFQNTLPKVIFFLGGKFRHQLDHEAIIPCGPGFVMINLRDSFQTYTPLRAGQPGTVHAIRITFNPDLLRQAMAIKGTEDEFLAQVAARLPRKAMLPPPASALLPELIHEIRREVTLSRSESRCRVNALLRLAILELIAGPRNESGSQTAGEIPLLERIESFLEAQLHRSLTLAEVAGQVDRSEEHIARFYREQRGTTVFRELRRRRIEKAKYYLLCSDLSVTDVAEQTGFSNVALFSRVFRQETGKSPTAFRLKNPGL